MADLPGSIRIDHDGPTLVIDGHEFPWLIHESGGVGVLNVPIIFERGDCEVSL